MFTTLVEKNVQLIVQITFLVFSVQWNGLIISAAAAKSLQSCPTLCDPIDGSPLGSPIPGILQARTLEWFCYFLLQCMKVKSESEIAQLCPTLSDPMDCNLQAPPSMGFSRQKYWSGVPTAKSQMIQSVF